MPSPLNTFRSIVSNVITSASTIYTCPSETTTIVLLAQATNVHPTLNGNVTFYTSNGGVITELTKNFIVPSGDAAALLSGKLVVEAGTSLGVFANSNNTIKLTLSILETQ